MKKKIRVEIIIATLIIIITSLTLLFVITYTSNLRNHPFEIEIIDISYSEEECTDYIDGVMLNGSSIYLNVTFKNLASVTQSIYWFSLKTSNATIDDYYVTKVQIEDSIYQGDNFFYDIPAGKTMYVTLSFCLPFNEKPQTLGFSAGIDLHLWGSSTKKTVEIPNDLV